MTRGLALFDFDGTITTRDTLFEVIKYQKGIVRFYLGILWLLPMLTLFKLKLIPNAQAKERVLTFFFSNQPEKEFQHACDLFIANALPGLLRKEALVRLESHKKNNDRVVVVSASAYSWVEGWCQSMNIELIATRLESKNGLMTGKLESLNCNGEEKVRRIKEFLNIHDYLPIYAYGDSSGDKPMLALANHPFFREF